MSLFYICLSIFGFLIFTDLLAQMSIRWAFYPKEKPLGPFSRLIYIFSFPKKVSINRSLYLTQFFTNFIYLLYFSFFLFFSIKTMKINLLFLTPLIFGPFFSLLINFYSQQHLNITSGLRQFRMKTILNLIQAFCLVFITWLWPDILYIKILFSFLGFLSLTFYHYIYIVNQLSPHLIDIGFSIEKSAGFSNILFLWAGALEIIYYLILWYVAFFNISDIENFFIIILSLISLLSFISFLGIKNIIRFSYRFLETKVLVSVLFLFGFISLFKMYYK